MYKAPLKRFKTQNIRDGITYSDQNEPTAQNKKSQLRDQKSKRRSRGAAMDDDRRGSRYMRGNSDYACTVKVKISNTTKRLFYLKDVEEGKSLIKALERASKFWKRG